MGGLMRNHHLSRGEEGRGKELGESTGEGEEQGCWCVSGDTHPHLVPASPEVPWTLLQGTEHGSRARTLCK